MSSKIPPGCVMDHTICKFLFYKAQSSSKGSVCRKQTCFTLMPNLFILIFILLRFPVSSLMTLYGFGIHYEICTANCHAIFIHKNLPFYVRTINQWYRQNLGRVHTSKTCIYPQRDRALITVVSLSFLPQRTTLHNFFFCSPF